MEQTLEYFWVDEDYELVMETFKTTIIYDNVNDIPPYYVDHCMIKPNQIFKHPFKNTYDLIVLCDLYYVNCLTEPPELIISEKNQRKQFNDFMNPYKSPLFKITQKYNNLKNIFLEHKKLCKYIGIDIFSRPYEYSIFTEKENVYNYVWVCRFILYKLTLADIQWGELLLVSNTEDDLSTHIKNMKVDNMEELFEDFNL